jgi:DNA-binding NarL/FixJ family response regulator
MATQTTIEESLAPELEAIAAAATARLRGQPDTGAHDDAALAREVGRAAAAAIVAGLPLGAIAEAERVGEARARDELGPDVLRRVERAARRRREIEAEYEQAVLRAVRLGLAHREIAGAAAVAHGTVRAIIARIDSPPADPAARSTVTTDNGDEHQQP